MTKVKGLDELTGLRFFAAFHVVLFHQFALLGETTNLFPTWIKSMIHFGDSAVAFFFILSGFILTYVYTSDDRLKTTKKEFFVARFSRIYPVYLFAFIIDLPRGIQYFLSQYSLQEAFQKIGISAFAHLSMIQSWHPRLTPTWNSPGWSLSTEMFFYFMFPFLLPIILKKNGEKWKMLVLYALPILLYLLLHDSIDLENGMAATFWRSFPILRLTEFVIGMYLGKWFILENPISRWMKHNEKITGALFWLALTLSLSIISIDFQFPRGILANTFLLPLFSIMILTLATVTVPLTHLLRMKPVLVLGGASYALYVIHVPLLFYIQNIFNLLNVNFGLIYFYGYVAMAISLSILIYYKLEIPMQKILRNKLSGIKVFSK